MKKLSALLIIILLAFVWSCGGGSETKKETAVDTSKKTEKSYDLKTKEGILMKIKDFNISIPEELKFVEVKRKENGYVAVFEAAELNDATVEKLQNWFNREVEELTNEGWRPRPISENDEMFGSIINQVLFYKSRTGSTLQDAIDFSTKFDTKEKNYQAYILIGKV
ncbi:MAG: hypothetical protein KDC58_00045 [Cyclobacteriaceae bacterium]|nr:hypothetical protein [Cyclobacteriaceae bacterium]